MFLKIDGPVVAVGVALVLVALALLFPDRSLGLINGARETLASFLSPGMAVPGVSG